MPIFSASFFPARHFIGGSAKSFLALEMNSEKKKSILLGAALALATLALFWPVLHFEFNNYDDPDYVSKNIFIQSGLTWDGIVWAFRLTGYASNWHPLTWISHMLDWQIYGKNAGGHHLTNLLFHIANSVLLFLVLKKMTGAIWRSAMVAALFAWHPLHVESVAWVAERKDVLSGFFWMLTMWVYAKYAEGKNFKGNEKQNVQHSTFNAQRSMFHYVLALIFFALGLMSKPMLVTLPFVLLLLDFWPLKRFARGEWRVTGSRLLMEKIPFFALALASSVITFFVQRHAGTVRTLTSIPTEYRWVNVFLAYFRYLGKMFWPSELAVFYPLPDYLSLWLGLIASIALLGLTVWICFQVARGRPYFALGWFWYLGTLVPVIGFVQVGAQSMADRYSYIPLIGIFILLVWWLADLAAKWPRQKIICGVAAAIVLGACWVRTAIQVPNWRNSFTLFEHALATTGDNFVANINLGSALMEQGKFDEALQQYEISLRNDPTFEAHVSMATIFEKQNKLELAEEHFRAGVELQPKDKLIRNNFGMILMHLGKLDEAAAQFSTALQIDPDYVLAHGNLGLVAEKKNQFAEAAEHYRAVLKADPKNFAARSGLGNVLSKLGQRDEGILEFSKALQMEPNRAEGHYNLAAALADQKKIDEAIQEYSAAIKLKPDYADAHNNLAVLLTDRGQLAEAAAHLAQVVQLRPSDAESHFNLSYVLTKLGKNDEARSHYRRALELNPNLLQNRNAR